MSGVSGPAAEWKSMLCTGPLVVMQGARRGRASFRQGEIQESAYRHQMEIKENEVGVVGVNVFEEEEEDPMSVPRPDFSGMEEDQRRRLEAFRAQRDSGNVSQALAGVRSAARATDNLIPLLIEAVKASATLGEINDVLREEWGAHDA